MAHKEMTQRPVMLGVVGDSASGKTTLCSGMTQILGEDKVTQICIDDYHKYNRVQRAELDITPLHPDCNYIDIVEQHLRLLREGQPILKPVYQHSIGDFGPPEYVKPAEFVIIEGLLGYHNRGLRDCFDVKIYLDPAEDLRRRWKIKRDTAKRGYTTEQVIEDMRGREPDSRDFIRPQRAQADIVVQFSSPEEVPTQQRNGHLNARLVLRPTIPHPDLADLLEHAGDGNGAAVRLKLGRDSNRPVDFLEIDGDVSPTKVLELEERIWGQMPEAAHLRPQEIGLYTDGTEQRQSYPLSLTQLLITYHLIRARLASD